MVLAQFFFFFLGGNLAYQVNRLNWVQCRLDEEMIETLFVVKTPTQVPKETTRRPILPSPSQENRVLDPKKSQNIAILLRALNVTVDEVCEALIEGNLFHFLRTSEIVQIFADVVSCVISFKSCTIELTS